VQHREYGRARVRKLVDALAEDDKPAREHEDADKPQIERDCSVLGST
jgi:hypothetical protein